VKKSKERVFDNNLLKGSRIVVGIPLGLFIALVIGYVIGGFLP
jgi:hypothetical protein